MKKLLALLVTCCLLLSCFGFAAAEGQDIVLLHTNDVHCGVDDNLGYAGLVAYAHRCGRRRAGRGHRHAV